MSEAQEQGRIRHVVVAVDHGSGNQEAVAAAVELAVAFHAELRGLFVVGAGLRSLAEHPLTTELLMESGQVQPWDTDRLKLELRARAEQARLTLQRVAEGRRVKWSWSVAEGDVAAEVLAASSDGDAIAIGRERWSSGIDRRRIATTAEVLRRDRGLTLIHRSGRLRDLPIAVLYDGGSASRRALALVDQLALGSKVEICVLVPHAEEASSRDLRQEVEEWARASGLRVRLRPIASPRGADVAPTLGLFRHHLLVLPADTPVLLGGSGDAVLESACSLLVVRANEGK